MVDNTFSIPDYVVFALMLIISAGIGFFYAWKDKRDKKQNTDEFLLGGRNLSIFPVAMSILASFTSAVAILGFSQEMYRFGTMYWIIGLSYFLTQPFAAHFYVPLFHGLNITSAYEYLEMRFNNLVRLVSSAIFCFQMFLYMAVALYTPSLAIEQVTGFPLWASILTTGIVCTIYTSLGGMKAVIWTDTFQVFVMFAGLITVIIKGSVQVGGFGEVWRRAEEGGRIDFWDFDPSPFRRHTFFTLIFGGFLTSLTVYGSNQATIQRYLTVPTAKHAIKAIYVNLMGSVAILSITCMSGLVAFAVYYGCDLLASGKISKGEQMLPYLVMDLLHELPGLPGLFIACVYSAALSTVSSGLNSLAAVCLKDFVMPLYKHRMMSEKFATNISKFMGLAFGAATTGLAYLCRYFGDTVLQIALSIFGMLGGPLLGVITLGIFVPQANSLGALVGLVLSTVLNVWIGVGTTVERISTAKLKKQLTFNCSSTTTFSNVTTEAITTMLIETTTKPAQTIENMGLKYFYKLSYLHYSGFAMLICFVFGILVSAISGFNKVKDMDQKLFFNYGKLFSCAKQSYVYELPNKQTKSFKQGKENHSFAMENLDKNSKENNYEN